MYVGGDDVVWSSFGGREGRREEYEWKSLGWGGGGRGGGVLYECLYALLQSGPGQELSWGHLSRVLFIIIIYFCVRKKEELSCTVVYILL